MDLVRVGWFVVPYLLNSTSYGHETCTNGYSKELTIKRMWRNTVTTSSGLELWTCEVSYVSWSWFEVVDLWYHISWTLYTSYGHETCTIGYSKDWGFMWNGIPHNDHTSFTPHPQPSPRLYPHNKTLFVPYARTLSHKSHFYINICTSMELPTCLYCQQHFTQCF